MTIDRRNGPSPPTARRHRALRSAALAVTAGSALVLTSGCARLLVRSPSTTFDPAAIITAGATREGALTGMRLSLSVRALAGPAATRLAAPAYLAIDGPDHLWLQVLSPFGVTVLDLVTNGDTFSLTLPLRRETREGRIDLTALAAGTTPEDERMIVALALLFRPKISRERCRPAGPSAVRCTITPDLAATITVDDALRPIREEYVGPAGRLVLISDLGEYASTTHDALPGRITISDGQGNPALVVRVLRAVRSQ